MTDTGNPWAEGGRTLDPAELFHRYELCVVRVQVTLPSGDIGNGTAFHIGGGAFVTAKHVVEGMADIVLFEGDTRYGKEGHPVTKILPHSNDDIDLAILLSDLWKDVFGDHAAEDPPKGEDHKFIPLPELWDDWIDDQFVLTKGMICGYPRVPFSRHPNKVAVSAEINADIDRYDKSFVHFIVSSVARGGFSGAPFICQFDFLLGVVTESLAEGNDTPFMAVLAIEPIYDIINANEEHLKGRLDHYLSGWSKNKSREA
ncbi:hypothetical protein IQ16_08194 [Bradyrhizobium huanghuaihaiense]|uniref:Trypsin-like peptidase n=1 Tax=Bradyrhizobium huanghuaihaiense TaxID=990078 RepID=A0A562QNF6_9BRAD|nr:trypsin-like peptidase domain-containing protein [Bradyrhizobium huanghuaihaiense]TWI58288.1 hypothetical protein IQ16_08194 [Bradyrhizobium huanghuaihaiense]